MHSIYEVWKRKDPMVQCDGCNDGGLVATFADNDKFLADAYVKHNPDKYYVVERPRWQDQDRSHSVYNSDSADTSDNSENSFFKCFTYDYTFNDGGDKTINFERVIVTRNIPELGLVKGTEYECVWWLVDICCLHFINWKKAHGSGDWEKNRCGSLIPDPEKSLKLSQIELGPYLVWWDEDLPEAKKFSSY